MKAFTLSFTHGLPWILAAGMVFGGSKTTSEQIRPDFMSLPLSFESNRGQVDTQVKFLSHGVLSGPAIERINKSPIEELIITNSIPLKG